MDSPTKSKSPKKHGRGTKLAPLKDVTIGSPKGKSPGKIEKKRDLMREVRRLNPAGVNTAPGIFWNVEGSLKSTNIDSSDIAQQMIIIENGVNYNTKRYNDTKVLNERLTYELKKKLDELENEKKGFEALDAMKNATTFESMRINDFKNQVGVVEDQLMEENHFARKLDHMLTRLKSNQLKFDSHMTGMEDTLRNIQKEAAEVKLMRRGVDAGLAKAVIVLEETKERLAYSRKDREVLVEQRVAEYNSARLLNQWLKDREEIKKQFGIEMQGDITLEEELFLKSQIESKLKVVNDLLKQSEQSSNELQKMESAFAKLKQVTGVRVVEEMHDKFLSQNTNKAQLEIEAKEGESRLATIQKQNLRQDAYYQELRSSGGGLAELNRDNIAKLEEALNDAKNDQKFIKADTDRLGAVMLGLQQGAAGLKERVEHHKSMAEGNLFELTQLGDEINPWTDAVDALTTTELVLTKMMEANSNDVMAQRDIDDDDLESVGTRNSTNSHDMEDEPPMDSLNVRIKSHKFMRDLDDSKIEEYHFYNGVGHEQEKKGHDDMGEGHESAGADIALGAINTGRKGQQEDLSIPSRLAVKKIGTQISKEIARKQEAELRRNRILERMGSKGGDVGDKNDALMRTAHLKAQKESADRLCVDKKPPTLPDGVTLRDDPMTKTNAFLNSMPKLT